MGIDVGSNMIPRLSKGAVDKQNWQSFIKVIKERYQNDDLVEIKPNYIEFKAGEHPLLPFEGHKFLRFSSGSHAKGVRNTSIQSLGSHRSALALGSDAGTRLPMNGVFTTGKRSIPRSNPISRFVMVYSI